MEHRLLTYFVAVAEEGTVSAAATHLHITQPALSRQIKKLEAELGLRLFQRSGVRLVLTSEGREFLTVAKQIVQAHAQAEKIAESLAAGAMRSISIAAPRTTLIDVVAPFVATFTPEDPAPYVSEVVADARQETITADYDLVVAPQPPGDRVASRPLAALPVWAYVPEGHRWAGQESVDITELCEEQLIVVPQEFKSRQIIESALHLADLAPRGRIEVRHGRLAQALAAAGRGAAVVTDDPSFQLHPVKIRTHDEPLRAHLHAAWRPEHHGADSIGRLAQRLEAFCTARYGPTLDEVRNGQEAS